MRKLIHKLMMRVIPWKCWGWPMTRRIMAVNYWANSEEFERLAQRHGDGSLTQKKLDRAASGAEEAG